MRERNREITLESQMAYITADPIYSDFHEDSYGKVNVIVFFLYSLANSAYLVTFAPISELVADNYHISTSEVNLAYAICSIGYLLLALPTNNLIENKGVRHTILISIMFSLTGIWFRLFINSNFIFAIIGNFIASLGRACSTHACPKISVK